MKGFVPTPEPVVDLMVDKLFRDQPPTGDARLLDPGCGTGAFIDGVRRWCSARGLKPPKIVGVELNPRHVAQLRSRFAGDESVEIRRADFLALNTDVRYDYIIGNPPYVPITSLGESEREKYRRIYSTAKGRFDLYLLFFEQSLRLLKPGGRLVFITPEKFLYVETAEPLRAHLARVQVHELHFVGEDTFGELVTYPLISTVVSASPSRTTRVTHRDGSESAVAFAGRGGSWLPILRGVYGDEERTSLADICSRVSCGVATGADSVFTLPSSELTPDLLEFAYPTLAGRQLRPGVPLTSTHSMLLPYDGDGNLLPERELGPLRKYLLEPSRRAKLLARTCVQRKPWYAFHETPPLREILQPKLLCKDIGASPFFVADRQGTIVPRHSMYYIVPSDSERLDDLADYLNSPAAHQWLRNHCQRAANGFIRLQSHVLKRLPIPELDALPLFETAIY